MIKYVSLGNYNEKYFLNKRHTDFNKIQLSFLTWYNFFFHENLKVICCAHFVEDASILCLFPTDTVLMSYSLFSSRYVYFTLNYHQFFKPFKVGKLITLLCFSTYFVQEMSPRRIWKSLPWNKHRIQTIETIFQKK